MSKYKLFFVHACLWLLVFGLPVSVLGSEKAASQHAGGRQYQFDLTPEEENWLAAHKKIVVGGETDWAPFDFVDETGKHAGIANDYLKVIGEELGIEVEIITGPSWDELLSMIRRKEIDVLPAIYHAKEREAFVNYTTPYIKITEFIFSRSDNETISSFADLKDKTISVVKGYAIEGYLRSNYPEYNLVPAPTIADALKKLITGEADAFIGDIISTPYKIKELSLVGIKPIAPVPFPGPNVHMAVRKDWPVLRDLIQKILEAIPDNDHDAIKRHWISLAEKEIEKKRPEVALTPDEQAWLKKHPVIRVHNEKDWPPFNFFEQGSPRGLSIDYMNLVAQKLGIKIEYLTGPSWAEFLGMVKRKELDVMLNIVKTEDRLKYIRFTEPYIKNPNSIVSSLEQPYNSIESLFGKTVAFPEGFFYEEVLTKSFPQINRLPVENTLASLKAVAFGRADAAVGEQAVFQSLINKNFLSGLRISGEVDIGDPDLVNLRLGVRDDWPLLHSALIKAMAAVTPREMNRIRQKWLTRATGQKDIIPLTDAERKWLARHRDIRLGVDPAWPPFEFIDANGQYAGISSGFAEAIFDRLNIKMTPPVQGLTWSQVIEKTKAGEIDVLPAVVRTTARDKYLNFTKPYLSFPIVIATNKNTPFIGSIKGLEGYRVGVVKDYYTEDVLRNDHPSLQLITYPTMEEALRELDAGRIDAYVGNMISISQAIVRSGLANTRISASTDYTFELSLGVRKDLAKLVGILNKVIDDIGSQERAAIKGAWISDVEVKIRFDFKTILAWAIPIGGSILLIMAFVIVWNRKLGREITERKLTEEQLRKLSQATENSPASVVVTDTNGTIEYVNPTFTQITGYSADEAIGKNPSVLKSGDYPESHYKELWDTIISGKVWRGEFKNRKKNGEEFWESASISPIKDEEGEITHFVAVKEDITEQKRIRKSLRESELRLRTVFERSPLGILHIGKDGVVLDCNDRHAELMGSTREKIVGMNLRKEVTNDKLRAAVDGALAGRQTEFEAEYTSISGNKTTMIRSLFSPTEPGTSPTEVINTTDDITERKQAEEAIRESREKLNNILKTTAQGFWLNDQHDDMMEANEAMCEILGLSKEKIIGRNFFEFLDEKDSETVREQNRMRKMGKHSLYEISLIRADGQQVPCLMNASPLLDADGNVVGSFGMTTDISARKKMEEELRRNVDELERFSKVAYGREKKMIQLKQEINEILIQLGRSEKYKIVK